MTHEHVDVEHVDTIRFHILLNPTWPKNYLQNGATAPKCRVVQRSFAGALLKRPCGLY